MSQMLLRQRLSFTKSVLNGVSGIRSLKTKVFAVLSLLTLTFALSISGLAQTFSQSVYAPQVGSFSLIESGRALAVNSALMATLVVDDDSACAGASFTTIQDAINAASPGDTIQVCAGTYVEDVNVNKANLIITGAGVATTIISGAIGGDGATVRISASNVEINNFTITRQGNNTIDWNNAGLNSAGVAVQGLAVTGMNLHDNLITGNRTGIDINNSNNHTIRNNSIDFNRTGLLFRNQTDNLTVVENFITNNWTVGVLFLDASGGSNVPVQTAANCNFSNNNLSGNWYGQIVDRQSGGSLPAPGTTNLKNFSANWFGTASPVITTANSAEPGYAAQIPVAYGGSAVPPGGQPDVAGSASANFDISPLLNSGTDTNVETTLGRGTYGFQGSFSSLKVNTSPQANGAAGNIQEAVNFASAGGTVNVASGTYVLSSTVTVNKTLTLLGASPKPVVQVAQAVGFAFSFSASGITFDNFEVQKTNVNGVHNLLYVGGNNFTAQNNLIYGPNPGGTWNATGHVSRAFEVTGGLTGLLIQNNTIHTLRQPAYINASSGTISNNNVSGTKGWVVDGAVLAFSGNTFGEPQNQDCDIALINATVLANYTPLTTLSANNDNAFICSNGIGGPNGRANAFVDDGAGAGGNGSDNANYQTINAGVAGALPGGTVTVAAGTYAEAVNINKAVTVLGPNANINPNTGTRVAEAVIVPNASDPLNPSFAGPIVVTFAADGVTFKGFTVDGDNPSLTSGIIFNGADVDAEFGIYGTETANPDAVIQNNIVKNIGEMGIWINSNGQGGAKNANSVISFNKVDNLLGAFGQGIRISDDAWLSVLNNVVTRVRNGIVIENYSGNTTTHPASVIGNNSVSSFRIGIRHNLHYVYGGPGFTISDNTVTAYAPSVLPPQVTMPVSYQGIRVESIQQTVFVTVVGNTLNGNRTAMTTAGYTRLEGLMVTNSSNASPNISFSSNSVSDYIRGVFNEDTPSVPRFTCNSIFGNTTGVVISAGAANGLIANINNINGNGFGMQNNSPATVNAQNNWWGAANGPGGVGPGSGDAVSTNVNFNPFLTSLSACVPGTIVVTQNAPNGWAFFDESPVGSGGVGSGAYVVGPGTPPLGIGSARMTVNSTGRENLFNNSPGILGTRFDQITTLRYSSYQNTNPSNPDVAISLQFAVDYDLTDANTTFQGRLVFEPYQGAPSGTVQQNVWQQWDTLTGRWWASRTNATGSNGACPQSNPCTRAQLLAAFPNVGIHTDPNHGGIIFRLGGPIGGGFTGYVDAFTFNDTTFDFEPILPSVTINQAAGQSDPTSTSPINFTVVFSEPVTGFGDSPSDVVLSGTAGATTAVVTGSGTTYNVAVSGMTASGTVIAAVAAGAAQSASTNPNTASTSTDNTVTYNLPSISGQILKNNLPLQGVSVALSGSSSANTTTDANGNYSFANLAFDGNYLITPTLAGHTFEPINRSYSNLNANVTNANFTATTGASPRIVRVVNSYTTPGQNVTVPIEMVSQGNENSVGFSLTYNSSLIFNPMVALGADAAGGSLVVNNMTAGQIGILVALPSGQAFTAGTRQLVTITFNTAANMVSNTPVNFSGVPVIRRVANPNADPLPATFTDGFVVFSQGLEGDVVTRFTGDGILAVDDFTQVGNFVAGLDTVNPNYNEFERADCAPRGDKGDGSLDVTDFTQAGRYAAGLDSYQTAGGPTIPSLFSFNAEQGGKRVNRNAALLPRIVRVVDNYGSPGGQVTVSIEIDAEGDEAGVGFTLSYDASKLSNPLVQLGTGTQGAALVPANTMTLGKVGVVLSYFGGPTIQMGTRQVVTVRFDIAPGAAPGQTPLSFSGFPPVHNRVSSAAAMPLTATFSDGFVNILGPSAASVTIAGQVLTAAGQSIPNTRVVLTNTLGVKRSAISNAFGYYSFEDVAVGEVYILNAVSKRYTFTPQAVNVTEELTTLNLIAEP